MKQEEEILESLIAGGLIGAALGALITNSKSGNSSGALAGAALFATLQANESARKTNIPLILEEKNVLYEIKADGSRKAIKNIPKSTIKVPEKFMLQ